MVEYPDILGTDAPQSNAADLRTSGWEFTSKWRDRINEDWDYGISFALANSTTEITDYNNPTGALSEYYIGQKIGDIWGYETQGIFQDEAEVAGAADQGDIGANWRPGDIRYADLDGDGAITQGEGTVADPGDRRIIGNGGEQYTFGITTNVGDKNFSLSMFFQGVGKQDYLKKLLAFFLNRREHLGVDIASTQYDYRDLVTSVDLAGQYSRQRDRAARFDHQFEMAKGKADCFFDLLVTDDNHADQGQTL